MNHNIPISVRERFRRSIKSFIDRRIESHVLSFHIGQIVSYESDDIAIRIIDIEEVIEVSWKENLISVFNNEILNVGDQVVLAYSNIHGKFIILGLLSNNLEFIRRYTVPLFEDINAQNTGNSTWRSITLSRIVKTDTDLLCTISGSSFTEKEFRLDSNGWLKRNVVNVNSVSAVNAMGLTSSGDNDSIDDSSIYLFYVGRVSDTVLAISSPGFSNLNNYRIKIEEVF